MSQQSEYYGVYNIPADKVEDGKAFRVAIRRKDRKTGENSWFNVRDNFVNEDAAARVYNGYALAFFGKGAILNNVPSGGAGQVEAESYWAAKPNRTATREKFLARATEITASGHTFRLNTDKVAQAASAVAA